MWKRRQATRWTERMKQIFESWRTFKEDEKLNEISLILEKEIPSRENF